MFLPGLAQSEFRERKFSMNQEEVVEFAFEVVRGPERYDLMSALFGHTYAHFYLKNLCGEYGPLEPISEVKVLVEAAKSNDLYKVVWEVEGRVSEVVKAPLDPRFTGKFKVVYRLGEQNLGTFKFYVYKKVLEKHTQKTEGENR